MTVRPTHVDREHGKGDAALAADCAARIRRLFEDDLLEPPGVLHVASVWQDTRGRRFSLRITPDSPRSATDAFVLGLARARCDALVTTGRILREEPTTRHDLSPELAAWRRLRLGRESAPLSVVWTARDDLDLAHPLLSPRSLVVASEAVAERLAGRVREAGRGDAIEVVARTTTGLRDLLSFLRHERGLADVCVEAGPATASALYQAPPCLDELVLSVHLGPALPPGVQGAAFLDPETLERVFGAGASAGPGLRVDEPESGPWLFLRYRRSRLRPPRG